MQSHLNNGKPDHTPSGRELEYVPAPSQAMLTEWNAEASGYYGGFNEPHTDAFNPAYLRALWNRRKKILLGTLLLISGAAVLRAVTSPRIYEAKATVEVNTGRSNMDKDSPFLTDILGMDASRNVDTQVEILKAPEVQQKALKDMGPGAKEKLGTYRVQVLPKSETNLIEVIVSSVNPEAASAFSNAIVNRYLFLNLEQNRGQLSGARQYVEKQLSRVRQQLQTAQLNLKNYKEKNEVFDSAQEGQLLASRLDAIESQLQSTRAKRNSEEAQLRVLHGLIAHEAPSTVVPTSIARRPQVVYLQSQLTQLRVQLVQARQEYAPGAEEIKELERRISQLQKQVSSQAQTEVQSWVRQPNELRTKMVQDSATLQSSLWADDAAIAAYEQTKKDLEQRVSTLPKREFDLTRLRSEVNDLQTTYDQLNTQFQNLKINEQARLAGANVLFDAVTPRQPVGPNRTLIVFEGLILGLLVGAGLALLIDRLDDHVYTDADIEEATRLPVLSYIPQTPLLEGGNAGALLQHFNDSEYRAVVDNFRLLRSSIAFSSYSSKLQSILITSAAPNDGKSSTALNLAVAAALSGEKVLLIDCDLRRPSLHSRCGLSNAVGFSSIAAGMSTLEQAIQETPVPNLRVLTSGPIPPDAFRLINAPVTRQILQDAGQQADFVIVDTTPLMGIADAQVLATLVDGVVLIASPQGARKREVARAKDLLLQARANLLGVVMNNIDKGFSSYYHYYYSYSAAGKYSSDLVPTNGSQN